MMSAQTHQTWPTLVSTTRLGKNKYWEVSVVEDEDGVHVQRTYWQGADGKKQVARRLAIGKNLGRSNETTPLAQALLEAEAEYKKQLDDGYQLESACIPGVGPAIPMGNTNTQTGLALPMLAHDFAKRGKSMSWPCFAQPKLDGFRCLFNSSIGFWSRGGKPFDQAVDLSHLKFDTQGVTYDGELILPESYTFQQTCQAIKKQRAETSLLRFHIFDVVLPEETYVSRLSEINEVFRRVSNPAIVRVETKLLQSRDEVDALQADYLERGYEGLILRDPAGKYDVGNRSPALQKYKLFDDGEFQIIGSKEGRGKDAGTIIFVCGISTPKGLAEFEARPKGTHAERSLWWQQRDELVGRFLKVKYQGLTDEGKPRFPIGIEIRDMTPAGQPIE
jgi:DNA ligase-1